MPIAPLANLGPWLGSPFYTLFSTNTTYCFTAHANVTNHRTETETLDGNLHRVEERIKDGFRNGLIPTVEADKWVQRAKEAISEEAANRKSFGKRCRIFGCSLNCWGNYKTSKQAAEKVVTVRNYISSTPLPDNVTRVRPPPHVEDLSTHTIQLPPSREDTLRDVLRCIKDDLAVGLIGIWGPDRDRKTHFLKKINDSFLGRFAFDYVIFVTASSECTVQNTQAQITNRLRINQHDNEATQATRIFELLRTKSFLLLVDDLRVQLDLQAVGIPYPLGVVLDVQERKKVQRKVVVTSISQSIFDLMAVDKYIQVLGLEEEEARQLFQRSFGEENLYTDPLVGVLAKDLVRELMGQPSDLIHFGKIMRRSRDARQWEVAIDAVKRSNLRKDNTLCMAEIIVENLEDSTKDLVAKRNDVYQKIENAEREGKTSTNEVNRWLEKVAIVINDVEVISVNCKLKKDVTMSASEKLREVQQCLSSCPSTIAIESMPPPVKEMLAPSMPAENLNLQYALYYIKDDPAVGIIGIWGPGGVGKTHLLKNINNSFREGMTFNFVLFVTASRGWVQTQIIERLRLQHTGLESKSFTIHEYMKVKSFLVLLDDLWDQINLEDVGIPYPLGNVKNLKRKVVLTTRLRKVCGQMKVMKELKVPYLQEEEAWLLFEENIGVETLSSPHIEALARELMKELKGLPLALTTIGKAMYRKDAAQWETAIQYMQQSCCTDDKDPVELGMETNVFRQLKFSYDNLRNKTLRDCFLACTMWPEDAKILKADLARCWMGLGLVNEPDIESSFRKSYSLISDLTAVCLLEGWGDWYGFVTLHDVIRDMAIWISCDCGENNDKWSVSATVGKDNKIIIPRKAECISLMSNQVTQIVPIEFNPYSMKLRILCLRNNNLDESIIAGAIKNFTSLTYLDLSNNKLGRIPEELCSLAKLECLDLSENELLGAQVPHCFGNLISLKFLYLTSSGIRTIPVEVMSSLKALQVIDLRTMWAPYEEAPAYFNPGVLFRELGTLPQLKSLGTEALGFAEFDSLREAANLPIRYLSLMELDNIEGAFFLSDILSNNFAQRTLYELDIRFCSSQKIIVRHDTRLPNNHFAALNKLRVIGMLLLKEITWMGVTPTSIFPKLTFLDLFDCPSLLHLSWVMYLPRLEQLHIAYCRSMVQAFMRCHGDKLCSRQEKTKTFPCLKFLRLIDHGSLDTIGDSDMEFPSLERLTLYNCPKLKRLPFQLGSLPLKLKELWLDDVQCWERLECEEGVKTFLQTTLKFGPNMNDM